jgi:hypothetical protein
MSKTLESKRGFKKGDMYVVIKLNKFFATIVVIIIDVRGEGVNKGEKN